MRSKIAIFIILVFVGTACIPFLQPMSGGKKNQTPTYQEDLSVHRINYELEEQLSIDTLVETEITEIDSSEYYFPVNDTVNAVLDSIAAYRLKNNRTSGYTILVYSSMSREDATKAIGRLYKVSPDTRADLQFQQPFFRVKVGRFTHEYHAYQLFNVVMEEFPNAVIIPETYKILEPDGN